MAYPTTETYPDYTTALRECGDINQDRELAEVTQNKTLGIRSNDLKVVLYPPNADATLTALRIVPGSEKRVLDFGGSFGLHYFLAKQCLPYRYRWAVVETEMIASLSAELATDELQFFTSIGSAMDWLGAADVVHASGSLQYTPEPKEVLSSLVALRAPSLAITRTAISLGPQCVTSQTFWLRDTDPVPGLPRGVSDRMLISTRIFMAQRDFVAAVEPFHRIVAHGLDDREGPLWADGVRLCLGDNFIFARK
jgi:putative methyltransferase (TIGR04325 family)